MRFPTLLATLTLIATVPLNGDGPPNQRAPSDAAQARTSIGTSAPEPRTALVRVGDPAPDFSFADLDGRWNRLRDLLAHGPVLLVFDAGERTLTSLQREREALIGMGVVPVAIADLRPGAVRSLAQRLNLRYPVYPDPRGIAASQFNAIDATTLRPVTAWFVVDRAGRVRALGRGAAPASRWTEVCSTALGIPLRETVRSARTR